MDLYSSDMVLEILKDILYLVDERIFYLLNPISKTQNKEDTTEKFPVLAENVERVREDNCFHEVSCSLSNQDDEKNLSDLFPEENIFINGSRYSGTWNAVGMAGIGRYIFRNGIIFEGELRDDKFHGHGSMSWPCGQSIDGVWANGKLKMKRYKFKDGLEFAEHDWNYCRFPDRRLAPTHFNDVFDDAVGLHSFEFDHRFYACITTGLRPARDTLKTNRHPAKMIPFLCYDVGNGIYDPDTHCITSYDSKKIIEIPTDARAQWIVNNCRIGFTEPTGYRPWLNENWSKKKNQNLDIPYCLPLSNDSPQRWWKRLSTFEHDTSIYRKDDDYTCKNCYLHRERGKKCKPRNREDTGEGSHCN